MLKTNGLDTQVISLDNKRSGARNVRPDAFELLFGSGPLPQLCAKA